MKQIKLEKKILVKHFRENMLMMSWGIKILLVYIERFFAQALCEKYMAYHRCIFYMIFYTAERYGLVLSLIPKQGEQLKKVIGQTLQEQMTGKINTSCFCEHWLPIFKAFRNSLRACTVQRFFVKGLATSIYGSEDFLNENLSQGFFSMHQKF